jgi:hypothetical protein
MGQTQGLEVDESDEAGGATLSVTFPESNAMASLGSVLIAV